MCTQESLDFSIYLFIWTLLIQRRIKWILVNTVHSSVIKSKNMLQNYKIIENQYI